MVGEEVVNASANLVAEIGQVALWLQGLGLIIVIWLVFQIANYFYNKKRMEEVYQIKKDMVRIEKKIDSLIQKKRK